MAVFWLFVVGVFMFPVQLLLLTSAVLLAWAMATKIRIRKMRKIWRDFSNPTPMGRGVDLSALRDSVSIVSEFKKDGTVVDWAIIGYDTKGWPKLQHLRTRKNPRPDGQPPYMLIDPKKDQGC